MAGNELDAARQAATAALAPTGTQKITRSAPFTAAPAAACSESAKPSFSMVARVSSRRE
jgi:hypothetical protein